MSQQERDRALALAGVVQAAYLVNEIANNSTVPADFYEASLNSVFKLDADTTEEIYGGKQNAKLGLKILSELLQFNQNQQLMPVVRYSLTLLQLERKLIRNQKMLAHIREKLIHIKSQADYFSVTDERVVAGLANLYQETISTFSTRIRVTGNPLYLNDPKIADQIRALLLCGIRSAVLWRQLGGRRLSLLFSFSGTHEAIEYLLNH